MIIISPCFSVKQRASDTSFKVRLAFDKLPADELYFTLGWIAHGPRNRPCAKTASGVRNKVTIGKGFKAPDPKPPNRVQQPVCSIRISYRVVLGESDDLHAGVTDDCPGRPHAILLPDVEDVAASRFITAGRRGMRQKTLR